MVLELEPLAPLPPLTPEIEAAVRSMLEWRREGQDHVLYQLKKGGRWREQGRVVPDADCPRMFRSPRSRGRISDRANLSWAKNAVFEDVLRDTLWDHRDKLRRRAPQT